MTMPNFLIIGAAKAGTTALYEYLKQHPQVYMSPVKEPNFFALEGEKPDFRGPGDNEGINRNSVTDIEAYRALFRGASNEIAIGEASPLYLYNPKAPQQIRHHIPDGKLIAILRDPIDRAYSGYLMHVLEGRETHTDFAQALQEEKIRIRDNWGWGRYVAVGFYYTQLKRYFDRFNRDQIKIYLYEDLSLNPHGLLQDIFRFLNVDEMFTPNISTRHNVSGSLKSKGLHSLIVPIKPILRSLLPIGLVSKLREQYLQYNLTKKPELASEVRQQLVEVYRDDILHLQDLIQRDLSTWLE